MSFTISIPPTAQRRARACVIRGHASVYKSKEQKDNETDLRDELKKYAPETPFKGALRLEVTCGMPIPASKPSWWREAANNMVLYHISKPDVDNLLKNLCDCLESEKFFKNDSQIASVHVTKIYTTTPCWHVTLRELVNPTSKKEYLTLLPESEE